MQLKLVDYVIHRKPPKTLLSLHVVLTVLYNPHAGGSGSNILIIVVPTVAATLAITVTVVVVLAIILVFYRRWKANSDGLLL